MKFFREFKAFIKKGNVLDLAVALLIGSAFTAIVNSLANDLIMPPISLLLAGLGLTELKWVIREAQFAEDGITPTVTEISVNYGNFIQAVINFIILALCVFLIVKLVNHVMNNAKETNAAYKAILHDKTLTKEERKKKLNDVLEGKLPEPEPAPEPEPEPAPAEPVETQEDILRDIRALLKANAEAAAEKEAAATVAAASAPADPAAPKRRGRKPGSKNKPKVQQ